MSVDLRLLGPLEGRRVLELGCGDGRRTAALAAAGAHVIVLDPDGARLAAARTAADAAEVKVELHQSDLADLAFVRADTVDAALSVGALGRVADLDRVFRQVHRVLRPDAPLLCSLPHPAADLVEEGDQGPAATRSYFARGEVGGGDPRRSHHHRTVADVFGSLTRANFRVDTLLEPEGGPAALVPEAFVLRARKVGM